MVQVVLIILTLVTLALYSFKAPSDSSNNASFGYVNSNPNDKVCVDGIFGLPPPAIPPTFRGLSFSDSDDKVALGKDLTSYKLVRSQVPLDARMIHTLRYQPPDGNIINGKKSAVFYTNGDFILYDPAKIKYYFAQYGLSYVIPLETNDQIKVHQNLQDPNKGSFIIVDIYQDSNKPDIKPEVFSCILNFKGKPLLSNVPTSAPISLRVPPQNKSRDQKQLQLEYFGFDQESTNAEGVWSPGCKPAIYLYPKEKTAINVKVQTKGFLTYTDPKYPEGGWNITAYPDGKLEYLTTNSKLQTTNYLYYESKVPDKLIEKPEGGFIVGFGELKNLYQLILPPLGLNETQTRDFIEYWEKALPYSPYYLVGIMDQDSINNIEPLEITPKPDYINRVRLYFQALDKKTNISELPDIPTMNHEPQTHNQFKVVEWGGMVKTDPLHPFTCSQ